MYKHRTSHSGRRGLLRHSIAKNTSHSAVLPFNLNQYSQHELRGAGVIRPREPCFYIPAVATQSVSARTHTNPQNDHIPPVGRKREKSKNNEQAKEIREKGDSLCGIISQ